MSRSILTKAFRLPNVNPIISPYRPAIQKLSIMGDRTVSSKVISEITAKEKELTNESRPVASGPTAQAQKHANEPITGKVISDITQGEKHVTSRDVPVHGGPAALAQSIAASKNNPVSSSHTGRLDADTISAISSAEAAITGKSEPVKGGPTAQAQSHAGEPINSQTLHEITEGEKVVTGGARVKGGPTSTAQSELSKSQSQNRS
ncbi:hypothetical protein F5Y02DRAFT_417910 [Annulohypoxylon stygium]|nr:hypothetical protein F5Y02DRAFT_417910 [Annulohypoxylon stygium]